MLEIGIALGTLLVFVGMGLTTFSNDRKLLSSRAMSFMAAGWSLIAVCTFKLFDQLRDTQELSVLGHTTAVIGGFVIAIASMFGGIFMRPRVVTWIGMSLFSTVAMVSSAGLVSLIMQSSNP